VIIVCRCIFIHMKVQTFTNVSNFCMFLMQCLKGREESAPYHHNMVKIGEFSTLPLLCNTKYHYYYINRFSISIYSVFVVSEISKTLIINQKRKSENNFFYELLAIPIIPFSFIQKSPKYKLFPTFTALKVVSSSFQNQFLNFCCSYVYFYDFAVE